MSVVGREDELGVISAFLERSSNQAAVLSIEGEPGIGKTTLWRAAVDAARARGQTVLSCSAAATEAQLSHTALRDLLADHFEAIADRLHEPQRRALAITLLREEPSDDPPTQGALAVAFLSALRALAEHRPTLVAIDDVQWLDRASASTVAYAVRRLGVEPIGVLLSQRPRSAAQALELDSAQSPRVERLEVGVVSVGALGRILHDRLDVVYPRPTLHRLHAVSRGNPFHALELARTLAATAEPLGPEVPLPAPAQLRELVRIRLATLPTATSDVLALVSALPRATIALVGAALGSDPAPALRPALEAEIIELDADSVRFAHPLFAAAVYELASPGRRSEVHAVLAGTVDDAEQRARHLALAASDADEVVARLVEEGARVAFARGSPASGAELAAHAVRLTPAGDDGASERRALLEADYLFAAGDTARAGELVAVLLTTAGPGPARARLLSRHARIQHFGADIAASVALLEQALAEVGDDAPLRAEIEEGLAWGLLLLRRDLRAAGEHARSAAQLAERDGNARALAEGLAAEALTCFVLGRAWKPAMTRALDLEPEMAGTRVLRHPSFAHGYCLSCSDRLDEARATFESLRSRAEQYGDEGSMPSLLNHLTLIACLAGRWDEAARLGDECHERALESKQPPTQASVLGKLALLAARRGQADEARAHAGRSLSIASGGAFDPSRPEQAMARGGETAVWALGSLELSLDDPEQAHRHLAPLCTSLLEAGVQEPGEIRSLPDEIDALTRLERRDEATALLGRLEEWERRVARPSVSGALHRCRALVLAADGDDDGALACLEQSARAFAIAPLPFERGQALLALGRAQRRARRRKAARETLRAALETFDELGASLWVERTQAELARVGGRAPSEGGLTPTEQRVAALVAAGKKNKEVAAELVVSVHTVEAALTSIYRKLEVRSRAELAHKLATPG